MVNKKFCTILIFVIATAFNHFTKSDTSIDHLKPSQINKKLAKLLYSTLNPNFRLMVDKLQGSNFSQNDLPRQIMLFSDYGTGLVDYAESIAHESGKEYFIISALYLLSEFQNFGINRIKEIFKEIAALNRPVIIMIKDLEEIYKDQSEFNSKHGEQALEIALYESQQNPNIFIIGTGYYQKNAPDELKKQFKSRFILRERSNEEKIAILEICMEKFLYDCNDACKKNIIEKTKKAEPQQIEQLVQQAALLALRKNPKNPRILANDFQQPLADYEEYEKEKNKPEEWTLERGADLAYRLTMTACLIGTITNKFPCWGPTK